MAILKILKIRDPLLRQKAKAVGKIDKRILKLIRDMEDTLVAQKDPKGVGLAASQVGKPLAICLVRDGKKIIPMLNPKIFWLSKKTNESRRGKEYVMEGCLSLPHYYGPVERANAIKIRYTTPEGKEKKEKFEGFIAQIIQHEVDHLNGKTFVERLLEQKRKLFKLHTRHWHEVELE